MTQNLGRLRRELPGAGISPSQAQVVSGRIDELTNLIEQAPKTRKWKLRARIGPRVKWYQEVAEKSETY